MGYGPPPLARDAWHEERLYWQRNPPKRPKGYLTTKEAALALGIKLASFTRHRREGHMASIKCLKRGGQNWYRAQDIADLKLFREMNGAR